jgi:hypothetical protein
VVYTGAYPDDFAISLLAEAGIEVISVSGSARAGDDVPEVSIC